MAIAVAIAAIVPASSRAQNGFTSIPVGSDPAALAVNPVTNKIYVANTASNNVTVVDGATNSTLTLADPNAIQPTLVAVDPVLDKIYVLNSSSQNMTVIDGASNSITTVPVGHSPVAIAVNSATGQVYVANHGDNNVTVFNGATGASTTVADPNAEGPGAIAVNAVTNKIYVANEASGNVTVIDGPTNGTLTVTDPNAFVPVAVDVDSVTNRVYVVNSNAYNLSDGNPFNSNVTVIDGASNATETVTVGVNAGAVAVNPAMNRIYVVDAGVFYKLGDVAEIAGDSNTVTTVPTGASPFYIAVNSVTNKIYVSNFLSGNVTIVDGATNNTSFALTGGVPGAVAVDTATDVTYVTGGLDTIVAWSDKGLIPAFAAQPQGQTVDSGGTVVFTAPATGTPPLSYEWDFNGQPTGLGLVISGAETATFLLTGVTAADAGNYTCKVTSATGISISSVAALSVVSSASPGRLTNLSCRATVGTGASQLIAGFVVGGAGTSGDEPLLVRASGPALGGFNVAGFLADPQLQLVDYGGTIASNDGWGGKALIVSTADAVGAFAWSDAASHDSALVKALPGGKHTQITGSSGDTGVALAELYDATPAGAYTTALPRLTNISARAQVGTGNNVLIAGFSISGDTSETVLLRGSGPALEALGVAGTLPDPQVQLFFQNGDGTPTSISSNSGWGGGEQIEYIASSVGAFTWGLSPTPDSAILVTLGPGSYTAVLSGESGDTGIALIEVYEVR